MVYVINCDYVILHLCKCWFQKIKRKTMGAAGSQMYTFDKGVQCSTIKGNSALQQHTKID